MAFVPAAVPIRRMPAIDRKHQLLETALDVFSRKGFEGATTKEIAAAAGITEAVIFRHFPTKQALYTAVLDDKLQAKATSPWNMEVKTCMEREDDEGLFRVMARHILENYRRDTRFERMILFAALEGHDLALSHFRQHALPFFQSLEKYIRRRQAAGALKKIKPECILLASFAMAHQYAQDTQMFGFPRFASDEGVVEAFVSVLMNGVRPAGSKRSRLKK
jgi:TetR/AcrR family transcriptional regulator